MLTLGDVYCVLCRHAAETAVCCLLCLSPRDLGKLRVHGVQCGMLMLSKVQHLAGRQAPQARQVQALSVAAPNMPPEQGSRLIGN